MKMLLTADRVRSALDGARSEKDIVKSLRRHKIRFSYDTRSGFTAFRIPARSGSILVYRTCSRSAPFAVRSAAPADYPYPIPRWTWDD